MHRHFGEGGTSATSETMIADGRMTSESVPQ
jgi:hypothetical protein